MRAPQMLGIRALRRAAFVFAPALVISLCSGDCFVGGLRIAMRSSKPHAHSFAGPNAISSDRLTATERLNEVALILALGLVRLRARQSSRLSAASENSFVDFA